MEAYLEVGPEPTLVKMGSLISSKHLGGDKTWENGWKLNLDDCMESNSVVEKQLLFAKKKKQILRTTKNHLFSMGKPMVESKQVLPHRIHV